GRVKARARYRQRAVPPRIGQTWQRRSHDVFSVSDALGERNLLHRHSQAVALEGGPVGPHHPPDDAEAHAINEGCPSLDFEVKGPRAALRGGEDGISRQGQPGGPRAEAVWIEVYAPQHRKVRVRTGLMQIDRTLNVEGERAIVVRGRRDFDLAAPHPDDRG